MTMMTKRYHISNQIQVMMRSADDLGLRRQFYYQLLEKALQYQYNQDSPAEAFSFDEDEYKCRRDNVDVIVTNLELIFSNYKGKVIRFLSNWEIGGKDGKKTTTTTTAAAVFAK
jgi:hypothetical protein